jgi:thiol-disulfide isomerase/thioredoxin
VYLPFCPCKTAEEQAVTQTVFEDEDSLATSESVEMIIPEKFTGDSTAVKDSLPTKPKGPVAVKSRFSSYAQSNGKTYNLDKDKYLVCFFAPGCDHCQEAAKQLAILSKKPDFPKTFIFFMDEEAEKIPEFLNIAGKKFPNRVLDAAAFWTLFGDTGETPGVFYLWNGNIMKEYDGINEKKFKMAEFKTIVTKIYGICFTTSRANGQMGKTV